MDRPAEMAESGEDEANVMLNKLRPLSTARDISLAQLGPDNQLPKEKRDLGLVAPGH